MEQGPPRVDKLMQSLFPGLMGRHIEEAIESGLVIAVDGRRLKKGERLEPEKVDSHRLADQLKALSVGDMSLPVKIVAQDAFFVLVDKPEGMPSQPQSLFDSRTITQWAIARFPELKKDFPETQPTVAPICLDNDESGLLVVAKNRKGFELWKARFERGEVIRRYECWCWGLPKEHRFVIARPIGHFPGDPGKMVAITQGTAFDPPSREAATAVHVVKRVKAKGVFLAQVQTSTDVNHQVRVHMAALGYPVVGDTLYDPGAETRLEKPPHCHLRVFEMEHGGKKYAASTEEFESRFT